MDRVYLEDDHNPVTRSIWGLKKPIRDFLETVEHRIAIDRGDFGEGAEIFIITLYDHDELEDFLQCLIKIEDEAKCANSPKKS